MKYFLDTEFHESKKPVKLLGITIKEVPTIDLISIGIVAEDGREYYAINKDCDLKAIWANEWLRKNVLPSIHADLLAKEGTYGKTYHWNLMEFSYKGMKNLLRWHGKSIAQIAKEVEDFVWHNLPDREGRHNQFFGYYADYDWVAFCWMFGRMIDLPKSFPMYCRDLKQMMDEKELSKEWKKENCPDPEGEHNALIDAKWNFQLYKQICAVAVPPKEIA